MLSTLEVPLPVSTGGGVLCAVRTAFPEQLRDWRYMMCRAVPRDKQDEIPRQSG